MPQLVRAPSRRPSDAAPRVAAGPLLRGRVDPAPRPAGAPRSPAAVVFLLYAAVLFGFTRTQAESTNTQSRLMTMKMIVEHGTLRLDDAPFVPVDHVTIDGHDYSDKPPVLPAIGSVIYAGLHRLGYDLYGGDPAKKEYRRSRDHQFAVLVLTLALVGLSSAAATASMGRRIAALGGDETTRSGLWLAFAFGTLFFSYAVELNNHVVAGAALWGAFALVFLASGAEPPEAVSGDGPTQSGLRTTAAGLLAGVALVTDPPAGALFLPLFAWQAWAGNARNGRRALAGFTLGAAPPLLLHCLLQPLVTGSVLPAQCYYPRFFPETLQAEAGASDLASRLSYTARILAGPFGLLALTPTLLFSPLGIAHVLRRGTSSQRRAGAATAIASVILVVYYGFAAPANHGGEAYGFRWFIAVTPVWYYFACVAYHAARYRSLRAAFWCCAAWSIAAATSGAQSPWLREHGNWWLLGKVLF